MTLINLDAEELRPFVDRVREVSGPMESIQSSVGVGRRFGYRVALDADGTLNGQVMTVAKPSLPKNFEGTKIGIFSKGVRIASTTCDASGRFRVRGMRPGVYGLIAAGPQGYAAFAFEVIASDAVSAISHRPKFFVSRFAPPARLLPVVLVPPPFCPEVVKAITDFHSGLQMPPGVKGSPSGAAGDAAGSPVAGGVVVPSDDDDDDGVFALAGSGGDGFVGALGRGGGVGSGGGGGSFTATSGSGLSDIIALGGLGAIFASRGGDSGGIALPTPASESLPAN
jgi:hypothetical protein